jgi:hypothetical protein
VYDYRGTLYLAFLYEQTPAYRFGAATVNQKISRQHSSDWYDFARGQTLYCSSFNSISEQRMIDRYQQKAAVSFLE